MPKPTILQLIWEQIEDIRENWDKREEVLFQIDPESIAAESMSECVVYVQEIAPDLTEEQARSALLCALIKNDLNHIGGDRFGAKSKEDRP